MMTAGIRITEQTNNIIFNYSLFLKQQRGIIEPQ